MIPTPAAQAAAEEIIAYPFTLEKKLMMARIIDRHTAPKAVTAEDVAAFIQGKISELRAICPDYISFAYDAIQLNGDSPVVSKFRVYTKNTSAFEGADPDILIRQVAAALEEKGESYQLRQQAADLLARANELDRKRAAEPENQSKFAGSYDAPEQAAFELWLADYCPSGDAECVKRQWEASSEFRDFIAEPEGGEG